MHGQPNVKKKNTCDMMTYHQSPVERVIFVLIFLFILILYLN
jgi:hypothetical protein